jgi:hypothetical protein
MSSWPQKLTLRVEGSGDARKLVLKLNDVERPLEHFHFDTFQVPENPLDAFEKLRVTLPTDVQGELSTVQTNLEPSVKEIVFRRVAEKRMFETSFLRQFTGVYDRPGQPMTVALAGESTQQLIFPGAPPRRLIPRHGTRFDLEGLTGVTLEFKLDASGQVPEVVIYTPDSAFAVPRKK